MTSSRFEAGKKYPFITHTTERTEDKSTFNSYDFNDSDHFKTIGTKIVMLKCVSEHDVDIDYSENKTKGYIFVDDNNIEYHNQYPTASYGQTSTIGDFIASGLIKVEGGEIELVSYISLSYALKSLENTLIKAPERFTAQTASLFEDIYTFLDNNGLKAQYGVFMEDYTKLLTVKIVDADQSHGVNTEVNTNLKNLIAIKVVWVVGYTGKENSDATWYHTEKKARSVFDEIKAKDTSSNGDKHFLFPFVVSAKEVQDNICSQVKEFFDNVDKSSLLSHHDHVELIES